MDITPMFTDAAISELASVERFIHLDEIDSTNTYAKQKLESGMEIGRKLTVICAGRQTQGRGRQERRFHSSMPGGLWTTLVVPIRSLDTHFHINRALSLAICASVKQAANLDTAIKWPNDLYSHDRKICGILLETVSSRPDAIIAGFGLNVNIKQRQLPHEIATIATSLQIETGNEYDLTALLGNIITNFSGCMQLSPAEAHRHYCSLVYRQGARIAIDGQEGIFEGVEEDGHLVMRRDLGITHFLSGTIFFIG